MTRIAIVGGGRAATLHAEAALATPGVELVGVGGRPGSAAGLAAAVGVPDLALEDLAARADGMVLAVPPNAATGLIDRLPADIAVLVESPVRLPQPRAGGMTAVNLLHSTTVKRGLRAIAELGDVHHLALRGRAVPRDHATDIFSEPFAGVWPVLLLAAGSAAISVAATATEHRATASLAFSDARTATAELEWVHPTAPTAITELEAAGSTGVVTITLWPTPALEIDGRTVTIAPEHPLVALGFVEQMRRFAATCAQHSEPWPTLDVGIGVTTLTSAAARSASSGGARIDTSG